MTMAELQVNLDDMHKDVFISYVNEGDRNKDNILAENETTHSENYRLETYIEDRLRSCISPSDGKKTDSYATSNISANSSKFIDRIIVGNGEPRRKAVSKNSTGIEDPDTDFKRRGQWLACTGSISTPMLRRYSVSGTLEQDRFSRKRAVSSSSATPRKTVPSEDHIKCMSSFHRSLKLLGLQPQELGISSENVNGSFSYSPPVKVEPTFRTRLTKRSFSLENLRHALQDQIGETNGHKESQECLDRKTLANAVYEEWYFQKQEEARKMKEAQEIKERKKLAYLEKVKAEQKQKTEENFMKWKAEKMKQKQQHEEKKQNVKNRSADDIRIIDSIRRSKPNQEEVFLLWKKEKDKMMKVKNSEKCMKNCEKSNDEKKASAQMAYKMWKKRADEAYKEMIQENERKKQEEEENKKKKVKEKHENAEAAFRAWKKRKDAELRRRIIESRLTEEQKKDERLMHEAERLYDCEQVFEEWLEHLEERRNKQVEAIRRQKQMLRRQIPWSPGGVVH